MLKAILKKMYLFQVTRWAYRNMVSLKNKIRNLIFPTAIILTYHRVANSTRDPHQLAVTSENFYDQLKYLKENYKVISLDDLIIHLQNHTVSRGIAVITFDDGYADNLHNALPILEKLNLPATIFVSSGHIDTKSFHWDHDTYSDHNRPMTKSELSTIGSNKLISIGGHTISHPHTPTLTKKEKEKEITEDKKQLEESCNKSINLFSFPFGEFDDEAIEIAKCSGYNCVCILGEKRVTNNADVYRLPRFLVRNWNSKDFIRNIKYKFL